MKHATSLPSQQDNRAKLLLYSEALYSLEMLLDLLLFLEIIDIDTLNSTGVRGRNAFVRKYVVEKEDSKETK